MASALEKIAAHKGDYSCEVETLGECRILSPVRHHEFIRDGERILVTENESYLRYIREKLGHAPTFERAGPHEMIFHDPSWTRVGIVTAGGLCPGLNNVIKGLVEIPTLAISRLCSILMSLIPSTRTAVLSSAQVADSNRRKRLWTHSSV